MIRKKPPIPAEKTETLRRKITDLITGEYLSAGEISQLTGTSEKDVVIHLEHIRKTVIRKSGVFVIKPAACRKCRFLFRSRSRLKKPGKCPVCRSSYIEEPLFAIEPRD